MTVTRRIAALFTVKANRALERAEDPRELLDYSYSKQLELAQQVRRGVADVATSRKRVELQRTGLTQSAGKLAQQAQQALLRDTVRRIGTPLPDTALAPSGLVLPGSGMSLAQVTALLSRTDLGPVAVKATATAGG